MLTICEVIAVNGREYQHYSVYRWNQADHLWKWGQKLEKIHLKAA